LGPDFFAGTGPVLLVVWKIWTFSIFIFMNFFFTFPFKKDIYVCMYLWVASAIHKERRWNSVLHNAIQCFFFTLARCLCSTCSMNSGFLVTFFFFMLKLMCEAQEKQVEILSICKCKSIARLKWNATTWSHCGNCVGGVWSEKTNGVCQLSRNIHFLLI